MKTLAMPQNASAQNTGAGRRKAPGRRPVWSATMDSRDDRNVTTQARPQAEQIAALAFKIWQEQGCPEGCDEMNWRLAEQEILGAPPGASTAQQGES